MVFVSTGYPLALVWCRYQSCPFLTKVRKDFDLVLAIDKLVEFRLAVEQVGQPEPVAGMFGVVHFFEIAGVHLEVVAATLLVPLGKCFVRGIAMRRGVRLGRRSLSRKQFTLPQHTI